MDNNELLKKFYTSFSKGDSKGMVECYHENIVFQDPVFGTLKGKRACQMWEMLLSNKKTDTKISFDIRRVSDERGKVNWVAEYVYGEKKRDVTNKISGEFKFKDDKIIEHIDSFNLWKWTRQAMGAVGYLVGWTPFMKRKIQKTTNKKLDMYIADQNKN